MKRIRAYLTDFLKTLLFFLVLSLIATAIGAERAGRLDSYLSLFLSTLDLVLVATLLSFFGSLLFRVLVRKYKLR